MDLPPRVGFGGRLAGLLALLNRFDRSRRCAIACGATVLVASIFVTAPLVDHYYLYPFEWDSPMVVQHTVGFMHFFRHGSGSMLPEIGCYPPFFDGQFICYALAAFGVQALRAIGWVSQELPTSESLAIYAIRHVNVMCLVLSTVTLFAAARLLGRRNVIAILLSLVFLLSPPILTIDLLRIDHLIVFLLVVTICLSLLVTVRQRGIMVYALLGAVTACLANTKITAPAFAVIPATAVAWALLSRRCGRRELAGLFFYGGVVTAMLGLRFLLHAPDLVDIMKDKIADNRLWLIYLPVTPYTYYNWEYFFPYGREFIIMVYAALAGLLVRLTRRRQGPTVVLVCSLVVLSLSLFPMMKYPRGGYHLIPLFLLTLAAGFACAEAWVRTKSRARVAGMAASLLAALLLVPALVRVAGSYRDIRCNAKNRVESVRVTRILPREWFRKHVPPGSRVGVFGGLEQYCPPVWDLGYSVVGHLIAPPLLYPDRMTNYEPPSHDDIRHLCDIMLFSNHMFNGLMDSIHRFAPGRVETAWKQFFAGLDERYPMMGYYSTTPNYFVSHVKVYVINPSILTHPDSAFRDDPSQGVTFSPPLIAGGSVTNRASP